MTAYELRKDWSDWVKLGGRTVISVWVALEC